MTVESNIYSPSDHEFSLVVQDPPAGVDGTIKVQHIADSASFVRDEPRVSKSQSAWSNHTTFNVSGKKGGSFSFSVVQQAGTLCAMLDAAADAICEIGATFKDPNTGQICKGKVGYLTGPAGLTAGSEAGAREYTITFAEVVYEKE